MVPKKQQHDISPDVLRLVMGLNWSVQSRPKGNSQIRFWWPPRGSEDSKFQAVSTGTKTDKISQSEQTNIVADWFNRNGFKAPVVTNSDSLSERMAAYVQKEYDGSPTATVTSANKHMNRLLTACSLLGVVVIQDVTPQAFDAAAAIMRKRQRGAGQISGKSWKDMLFACRKFFRFHIVNGPTGRLDPNKFITQDPTINQSTPPRSSTIAKRKVAWTQNEFDATIENIGGVDADDFVDAMKLLRYAGGLDECDVFELHEEQFVKAGGRLIIKKLRGKHKRGIAREWIRMPVPKLLEGMVKKRLKKAKDFKGYLFPWIGRLKALTSFNAQIYKTVKRAREKAGYPMKEIKSLRHSFVTDMLAKGVPEGQIQEFLGHVKGSPVLRETYDLTAYDDSAID